MAKKWGIRAVLLFGVYVFVMYIYLFHLNNGGIPDSLVGTASDPKTFMTDTRTCFKWGIFENKKFFIFYFDTI